MLGSQAEMLHDEVFRACQNWFRPDNRFPAPVFGTLLRSVGNSLATMDTYDYVAFTPRAHSPSSRVTVVAVDPANRDHVEQLRHLALATRGAVYVEAEDLNHEDLLLDGVDQMYARVGLRRYRRIFLAYLSGIDAPIAGVIAYRGPLGLNFSFIENRTDLLIPASGDHESMSVAIVSLMNAVQPTYANFEAPFIPVITPTVATPVLLQHGGKLVRQYTQSIWLRDGLVA
jgi:hypothetical protein